MAMFARLKGKFFYGWWIVLACSILNLYGSGSFFYGFGAFVYPMAKELGWSMALISGGFSLYRLESGIISPIAGYLLDRFSARKLVIFGAVIMGLGFISLSRIETVPLFYVSFFLISAGWGLATGPAVGIPLIGKWFVRQRGKAIGLYAGAAGLSGLLVPVLAYFITTQGWRNTLLFMGPTVWLLAIPLSFVLKNQPEDCGMAPDGQPLRFSPENTAAGGKAVITEEIEVPLKKALMTPAFWIITIAFFGFQITMSAIFVHLIPSLVNAGIETGLAALTVTFITLISTLGRLGSGWLSDLHSKKWLLVIIFFLQGIGIFAFANVSRAIHLLPFVLAYGPSYGGAIVVRSAILGEYYGRKYFGTIHGVLLGITMIGGIIGPIIAGLSFDLRGSYYPAFIFFSVVSFLAAFLLLWLKKPRFN